MIPMSETPDSRKMCMGCMSPLPEGRNECGICGYPANGNNPPLYLPVRTVLSERYLVGKLLESVGDAAVYIGYDQVLKAPIIIREFLPDTLCDRDKTGELHIISGCENTFRDYFGKFRSHARSLARMRELTSVVSVYDIFEQNNTAYTVSEYCEGNTLETRLKQIGGHMRWADARPLFMPLMASLMSLHSAGIYHLGICPQNLIIGTDGKLHLQGFCIEEARKVSTDLRPKLISGYSAPEQYNFGQDIGAWSDVYGLAATIFRTLTGNPPPEGSKRAKDSNDLFVPSDVAAELPDHIASALFNALQINPESRTRSVALFRDQLSTAPAVSAMRQDGKAEEKAVADAGKDKPETKPEKKDDRLKFTLLIVLIVFIFLLLAASITLLLLFPHVFSKKTSSDNSYDTSYSAAATINSATTTKFVLQKEQFAADDIVGQNYYDIKDKTFTGSMKVQAVSLQYSDKEKGVILSQEPSAGNLADEGSPIKVVISAGPSTVTVPDVRNWDHAQAKLYLEALGFRVFEMPVVSTSYDINRVESVSDMGKSLPVGSTLTLRYSNTAQTTQPADDGTSLSGAEF